MWARDTAVMLLEAVGMLSLVALAFAAGTIAVCGLSGLISTARQFRDRRTPSELRGDWWSVFEQDFRAYTAQASGSAAPERQGRPKRQS
jgi:hypothetical protein